jgi:hypothetical protein
MPWATVLLTCQNSEKQLCCLLTWIAARLSIILTLCERNNSSAHTRRLLGPGNINDKFSAAAVLEYHAGADSYQIDSPVTPPAAEYYARDMRNTFHTRHFSYRNAGHEEQLPRLGWWTTPRSSSTVAAHVTPLAAGTADGGHPDKHSYVQTVQDIGMQTSVAAYGFIQMSYPLYTKRIAMATAVLIVALTIVGEKLWATLLSALVRPALTVRLCSTPEAVG